MCKELRHLVVGNDVGLVVIEVNVRGAGDDVEFLVALLGALPLDVLARHALEGVLAEVAAVDLFAVDEQHGGLDLVRPRQQRLVEERLLADDIPAVGRVAAALVVAARACVVGMIFLIAGCKVTK